MKKCTKCGDLKELDDYRYNRKTKDGHMAQCKECQNAMDRGYNKSKAGKVRYNRMDEKRKDDPRLRIRALTRRYIKLGKIDKAKECCICGGNDRLEVHHVKYKVYEIVVMCKKCHRHIHQANQPESRVTVTG